MNTIANLSGYDVTEELYSGSRTLVYRGLRQSDQKPVVIKLLRNEYPKFNELVQFRNQYTLAKNLDLSSIVKPLDLIPYKNTYALVMEDFGGISLLEYLRQKPAAPKSESSNILSLADFFDIAIQLANSLDGLTHQRVIHKDIKPANILINPDTKQVKLIDFSISSLLPRETQEIQNPNVLEGTIAYLSPEQTGRMNRGIDYRTDFYSLGVTFYELLTGQLPFISNDPMELVHCHIAKIAPTVHTLNPAIPPFLSLIVSKLLAKNAEDRYQSAFGLKHDLEICQSQWQETGTISTFEIGQRDLTNRFLIPEKLYGREQEVNTLLNAFERVSQGSTEMMLVAGFSGIGKTVVVNEVHKPIVRQRGYFIKGKYDQFQRNIPFSAFVQAFRNLMGQLLSESDAQLQTWKTKILSVVGDNGQVLIEVIPELERIIGTQPAAPELSGSSAQNRFNLLMQKFVQVFTTAEHPLAIFLDDLQWSDSASLKLLQLLMQEAGHLLVLGAFRDNEVSPAHPFMLTVDEIQKAGATVNRITLAPLQEDDLNQLISDTLSCEPEMARPLQKLVNQKTKGNPFFATQFLKALHDDGQITFNWDLRHWQCDLAEIKALALTDDVVEFMALQLQKLPIETQKVLKLAACIGSQFDLNTLAVVSEELPDRTASSLWKALQDGLILPLSDVYKFFTQTDTPSLTQSSTNATYKFLHDRVQQAAYSLIPESERAIAHYQIGQLILQQISPAAREERIFELVNQLNYGTSLIVEQAERDELAKLNLAAARKARAATAYQAAHAYAILGLELLGTDAWQRHYEITLALHELTADVASLLGDFEQMNKWIELVIHHTKTPLERVQVYQVKIQCLNSRNEFVEAIATGISVLKLLGVNLPDIPTPENIQQAREEISTLIGDRSIEELVYLPKMKDVQQLAIMQVASSMMSACYLTLSPLYPLIVALQVKRSIQFGNSLFSPSSYGSYAFQLRLLWQEMEVVQQFGKLAYCLALEPEAKTMRSPTSVLIGGYIHHCTAPLRETLPMLQEGYQAGLETGNLEFAVYNVQMFSLNALWSGQPLPEVESQIRAYHQHLQDLKLVTAGKPHLIYWETALILLGKSEDELLFRQASYEETLVAEVKVSNDVYRLSVFYLHRFILNFWLEDFDRANQDAVQTRQNLMGFMGTIVEPVFYLYDSLTVLAKIFVSTPEQSIQLQRVQENQAMLQQWIHHAPMNHKHKWQLVEAERYRVSGQYKEAIEYYDLAIQGAQENNYLQEEALANELAAKFYLNWGKEKVAQAYTIEAYYCYARWGAKAKIDDLEKRYPQLLIPILQTARFSASSQETIELETMTSTRTSSSPSEVLDLATLLKASQTISGEIELDQLLTTLLQIVSKNAGADKCVLLLKQDMELQVAAIVTGGDEPQILPSIPLELSQDVAISLVNTVKRSLTPLVLVDARVSSQFAGDSYIAQNQPKSVLCIPIINQRKLIGILYLENNVTVAAFTNARVKVLKLVCTQAAISLENARLYQESQANSQQLEKALKQQKTLFKVVTQMRESLDLDTIFCTVSKNIRHILNADRVGIYQFDLGSVYQCGEFIAEDVLPQFKSALTVKIQDHCFGEKYAELYKQGRNYVLNDLETADVIECHRAILQEFNVRASLVVPIMQEDELWGLLCIHQCDRPRNWQPTEIQFIEQIAGQMGIALKQTELLNRTRQQATQLEQTLHYLQQTQLQLVQNEKMSALGNLVSGIAHEINNPVGFLAGNIKPALDYINDLFGLLDLYEQENFNSNPAIKEEIENIDLDYIREDLPKLVGSMCEGVKRIKDISISLRTFSRADSDRPVACNIHDGIDSTVMILKHRLKANESRPEIEVLKKYGDLPQVECYAGQLNQVFMNLLGNAIDALEETNQSRSFAEIKAAPNQVIIATELSENRQSVVIRIRDNGRGISDEVKPKIFDHLFTTKDVGKGTGLGLAIARQIVVEKHGGQLMCNSTLGVGTEFVISLPLKN
ncbi:trifunctional serine/threonine-protein kinase/ATP-binding protein/sensor histidine kinase [Phormidium nigroviride]